MHIKTIAIHLCFGSKFSFNSLQYVLVKKVILANAAYVIKSHWNQDDGIAQNIETNSRDENE